MQLGFFCSSPLERERETQASSIIILVLSIPSFKGRFTRLEATLHVNSNINSCHVWILVINLSKSTCVDNNRQFFMFSCSLLPTFTLLKLPLSLSFFFWQFKTLFLTPAFEIRTLSPLYYLSLWTISAFLFVFSSNNWTSQSRFCLLGCFVTHYIEDGLVLNLVLSEITWLHIWTKSLPTFKCMTFTFDL